MADAHSLDRAFGERPPETPLGVVLGGSLSTGLLVRLEQRLSVEHLAVGRYVVIHGSSERKFFGIVTDIGLDATNPDLLRQPPPPDDPFTTEVYGREVGFGTLQVSPMLMLDPQDEEPRPNKTVPAHFSKVFEASREDVERVFGPEDDRHLFLGTPLDMESVHVNLDLERFVERSSGVFGKSGTGKSFITRILLAGIIRAGKSSALIFDMHNDYGYAVKDEAGREFKGLRQLFTDGRVSVMTLDEATSRARGSKVDRVLRIGFEQIEPEDIELLAGLLGLNDVQVGALYMLHRRLQERWIERILQDEPDQDIQDLIEDKSIPEMTFDAIRRRLERLRRMDFLVPGKGEEFIEELFNKLNMPSSVVLEFGRHGTNLAAYLLVANFLTRRIHRRYVSEMDRAAGKLAEEPKPLVIVIEEAHKFLDPRVAADTIFGTIAREMRKYRVTLLIVDQRPSGIDDEVMSQIGTRVTCLLDNEADIRAVFSGVSGAGTLREVLARLDTRQQALILGHAVPMPVVIRTRDYDQGLYASLGVVEGEALKTRAKRGADTLFGD